MAFLLALRAYSESDKRMGTNDPFFRILCVDDDPTLRKQDGERHLQGFGQFEDFLVSHATHLSLNCGNHVPRGIPAEKLAARGQLRLGKVLLVTQLADGRADEISLLFHLCDYSHLTLSSIRGSYV